MKLRKKIDDIRKNFDDSFNESMNKPPVSLTDRLIVTVIFLFIGISMLIVFKPSIEEKLLLQLIIFNISLWPLFMIPLVWLFNWRPKSPKGKLRLKKGTFSYSVFIAFPLSIIPIGVIWFFSKCKTILKKNITQRIIAYIIFLGVLVSLDNCRLNLQQMILNMSENDDIKTVYLPEITNICNFLNYLFLFFLLFIVYFADNEYKMYSQKTDEVTGLYKWDFKSKAIGNKIKKDFRELNLYILKNGFNYDSIKEKNIATKFLSNILLNFIKSNNEKENYILINNNEIIIIIDKNNSEILEGIIEDINTKEGYCFEYAASEISKSNRLLEEAFSNAEFNLNFKNEIQISNISKWGTILRESINNISDFKFYLQPKVNLEDKIVGAEALVRWFPSDKVRKFVNDNNLDNISLDGEQPIPPKYFVDFYEHYNLIHKIDLQVLNDVVDYINEKDINVPISVNISRADFFNRDFTSEVIGIMKKLNKDNPKRCLVEFEITEGSAPLTSKLQRVFVKKVNQLKESLKAECELDVNFLLDDFGTGCSSIKSINDLNIDTVKIDQSFFFEYEKFKTEIEHILNLCNAKKKKTVAEGVSMKNKNEELYNKMTNTLKNHKCSMVQGYGKGNGKPVSKEVFLDYLNNPISIIK